MTEEVNEKEIVLRMAQSLLNEIKAREKGMTDVRPFAERYNLLKAKTIELHGRNVEVFLPQLSENLTNFGWTGNIDGRMRWFDETIVAISQLVSYLEAIQKDSFKVLTGLEEFLFRNLRKNVHEKPSEEKEIQNIIEIMLNSK